ncbi:MAG: hypothetical protein ACRCZI_14250 [Cetobacterium sp.]
MDNNIITTTGTITPKKTVKNVPLSDADLLAVAKIVSSTWASNTAFTLIWISATDFNTLVTNYENTFNARKQGGGIRPQYTKQLKELDKSIDLSLRYVKNYISDKYSIQNAYSYYAAFGIEKINKVYQLPKDRNNRGNSLNMLLTAIDAHGFTNMTYGKDHWTPIVTQYLQTLQQSQQTDSNISQNVGNKNVFKEQITNVLNALLLLLKANYPDTFKNEIRTWGFQKEKY